SSRFNGVHNGSTKATRQARASEFAATFFGACEGHSREAAAVYDVFERLARKPLCDVTPDIAVVALLSDSEWLGRALGRDSLDVVEIVMALQEEFGEDLVPQDSESEIKEELIALALFRALLGPAGDRSLWSSKTIWSRSVRGVINERVRWLG